MSYQVINPFIQFVDPINGKPLSAGDVYFGRIDSDPKNQPANRINVYAVQDNGSEVLLSQPIQLNGAGQPQYSGSVKQIKVELYAGESAYAIQVFSRKGAQKGYSPRVYSMLDLQSLAGPASTVVIAGVMAKDLVSRVNFKSFVELGGVADGVTDNRAAYVAAINSAAADGFTLVFTRGIYGFSDWIPLTSNLRMAFEEGAELKLLATTGPIGGFVIGGLSYPSAATIIPLDNCHIVNPTIDCNNLVGENGFSSASANGLYIYNPTIKNCIRSDVALGGRAFQFEGGIIKNVQVYSPKIIDCSIGINSQGDPSGAHVAANINYYDVYMTNVDVPFNIDSGFALPQTNTPLTMSTSVRGAMLYNCGRLTYPGVTDPIGGGIICGDRGSGLSVSDVRIINEAAYGSIGAVCRGTMFGVRLRNVTFYGSVMTAIFDHNPVTFGSPSGASWESYVDADDVTVDANLDYVVATKGGGGALGKSSMTNIKLKGVAATVASICDVNAATYANAVLEVVDVDNSFVGEFKGTGVRALDELAALGNQLNSETLGLQKINQTSGVWNPSYTAQSAGPAAITMSVTGAAWSRTGDVVTVWADIATSNLTLGGMAGAVIIAGLPYNAQYTMSASISDCNAFTTHPLTAKVTATTNYIELYKRSSTTGADSPLQPADLTAGAVAGANNLVVTLTYKAII